ncbi:odorant receptor 33b-like [Drosophila takahashii]|uniref:odorant receptor 33b-like n=1 Tax=Drosophila takahashii TaxID=29030 RepID=UPI00389947FC
MEPTSPIVRSDYLFRTYWLYWRILCVEGDYPLRIVLDILISFFVTFWCPTHLVIGLFSERSLANIFRNLPITASSFCSSFKFICFRWKLWEIKKIESLFTELDHRAVSEEERLYFDRNTRKDSEIIWKSVLVAYGSANLAANLTVLITNVLIPAWFPYDVNGSAFNHWLSVLYQSISGGLSTLENLANDSYTPMAFCVLAGHVRLLGMRLSRMGYDRDKSSLDISRQLTENIEDYKK